MCPPCKCTEMKQGKQCLTTYINKIGLAPHQWVVDDPGVRNVVVPSTNQFLALANLFSEAIMHQVCKNGCIEVIVKTGSVKFLGKPMGSMGCEEFGETMQKRFLLDSNDIAYGSWCGPATVTVTALA